MPDQTSAAFISYSREDSEFALRLAQDLKAAGARVWLDQLELKPGLPWDNAIEDALLDAQQMLVILSPTSVKSENVRDEISYALRQGKVVIPVLYMECTIPLRLERKQHIDCRTDYAGGLAKLLAELRVENPNQAVLDKAAEGDAKRHAAWLARESTGDRIRSPKSESEKEIVHIPVTETAATPGRSAEDELTSLPTNEKSKPASSRLWLGSRTKLAGGIGAIVVLGTIIWYSSLLLNSGGVGPAPQPSTALQVSPSRTSSAEPSSPSAISSYPSAAAAVAQTSTPKGDSPTPTISTNLKAKNTTSLRQAKEAEEDREYHYFWIDGHLVPGSFVCANDPMIDVHVSPDVGSEVACHIPPGSGAIYFDVLFGADGENKGWGKTAACGKPGFILLRELHSSSKCPH